MTTNLELLSISELRTQRQSLLERIGMIDREIGRKELESLSITPSPPPLPPKKNKESIDVKPKITGKKEKTKINITKTSSKKKTTKSTTAKSKEEKKESKVKVKTERKIKATMQDMKKALNQADIDFKNSLKRDELEALIRSNNLVRVAEKIRANNVEDK